MKRPIAAALLLCASVLLAGCGTVLYLPSDAVYEDVEVTTDADLRDQITVSADYCDDIVIQGTVSNNATSDASVAIAIGLDDGESPGILATTIVVPAGSSVPFELENDTGINPILGCSATVETTTITPAD